MLDADGYLRITDRKRDFIKNSGGDMIAPARVEGALTLEPEIAQAMVFGDRRPYLVAVIVPDPEFAAAVRRRHGEAGADLADPGARPGLHQGARRGRRPGQPHPARRSSGCAASSSPPNRSPPPTAR